MSPYLPFDLEELILCHLQCEPSSLKACSLVCHIFRHICQRFLFKDIIVRYPSTSPATVESSVCPFLLHEFLQSTPQIANAVRGVDIIADSYRLQDLDNFLPCPSFLENIRSIGLDTNSARPIYWCFLLPRTQQSLYNLSHSNRIVNIRFRRVFDLPISLIAECPSLEGLSLISVTFQRDNMLHAPDGAWKPSAMRLERPHLKSLHLSISTEAFRTFTDTLTGSPALLDLSALVKLSVSIFSLRFDYNRLNSFLHAVGNSLELFCFSPIAPEATEERPPLHLNVLPRLQTLRLRPFAYEGLTMSVDLYQTPKSHPIYLLTNPQGQVLEEVSVKADFRRAIGHVSGGDPPWTPIDMALSALPSIRKVTILTCQQQPPPATIACLFPHLHSKCLLRVQPGCATLGFLSEENKTDLLAGSFRRHNID